MDAQRISVDALVVLTGCDPEAVTALIPRLFLSRGPDPQRFAFKGPKALCG